MTWHSANVAETEPSEPSETEPCGEGVGFQSLFASERVPNPLIFDLSNRGAK